MALVFLEEAQAVRGFEVDLRQDVEEQDLRGARVPEHPRESGVRVQEPPLARRPVDPDRGAFDQLAGLGSVHRWDSMGLARKLTLDLR